MTDLAIIEELERKLQVSAEIKKYMLAGRATFTLKSTVTQKRFTYKISKIKGKEDAYYISHMFGPNNDNDFRCFAVLRTTPDGKASTIRTRRFAHLSNAPFIVAFSWFMKQLYTNPSLPATVEFWHSGRCGRCGKKLTVPESIAAGIGPECIKHM